MRQTNLENIDFYDFHAKKHAKVEKNVDCESVKCVLV